MMYYDELAHMITEAEKYPDLHLASWKLRKADGVSSRLKAVGLKIQEELMFWFELKGRKKISILT